MNNHYDECEAYMRTKNHDRARKIGNRIKKLRMQRGISQQEFAAEIGITPQAVSRWECGMSLPEPSKLPAIANILGVTINDIFETDGT